MWQASRTFGHPGSANMEFIEALKVPTKIKHPTQRGFKLKAWEGHKSQYTFCRQQSQAAHSFGVLLFKTLEFLRKQLMEADKLKPDQLSVAVLKRHFVGLSNRHRKAFAQHTQQHLDELQKVCKDGEFIINNLSGLPGASIGHDDSSNGNLTITDSAHQLVDNFRLVLGSLFSKSDVSRTIEEPLIPIDEMDWLHFQEVTSALYDLLESYWYLVVFEENTPFYDKINEKLIFNPVFSEFNVAKAVSLMRMENHRSAISALTASFIRKHRSQIEYSFPIESSKAKGVSYRAVEIRDQDPEMLGVYASAKNDISDIKNSISEEVCSRIPRKLGFSLNDVLEVFMSLRLFVYWKYRKMSNDTSYSKRGDLSRFNLEINVDKISKIVSKCIDLECYKVKKIIDFLHFGPGSNYDLWSNPLVEKNSSKSFVLISPFMDSVLSRNAEFWLRQMGISLGEKGEGFEDFIRSRLDLCISRSDISEISSQIPDKKITFSSGFEEIDSIIVIGDRVLVMELKNIVAVDSPVSFGTASFRIKEGVEQAKRKCLFIDNNKKEFIKRYELEIDPDDFQSVPVVLVSNFICAGCVIDDVPVTDQLIVEAFFDRKGLIPILSHDTGKKVSHSVEAEIYRSNLDAPGQIEKYLRNPPQIRLMKNSLFCSFYQSSIEIIPGAKAILRRIEVSQDYDLETIINTDFGFPLISNR